MKIDLGSFCFNMETKGVGGDPAWGTALGQSRKGGYKFNFDGMETLLPSMLYCSIADCVKKVTCRLGKGGQGSDQYEFVIASEYKKVYVNGTNIADTSFILLIVRSLAGEHAGRMTLKYGPSIKYGEVINKACFEKMRTTLGLSSTAAWFISELYTQNQDELHFKAHIVSQQSQTYDTANSRKEVFNSFLAQQTEPNGAISLQKIYFGAPGSGKSHRISKELSGVMEDNIFRTTFHPDSDYASFVGCYKPVMEGNEIKYEFTPQVFTGAYIQAWKNKQANEPVYLVIEEINRGNCAQIFGDLFQLLDRQNDGRSTYGIKADKDLAHYLEKELGQGHEGIKGGDLRLPPNLYIMATMNTSDQSLFPMDSAFKRRWDWAYVPIDYSEDVDSGKFTITIDGKEYSWVTFLEEVNKRILEVTHSEDKQMGNFFIKGSVGEDEFKSKVMFYLWNEVCKDEYGTQGNFFRDKDEKEFSFNDLYGAEGTRKLSGLMAYLKVSPLGQSPAPGDGDISTPDTTTTRGTEEMQVSSPEVKVEEDQGSADPLEVIDEQRS